MEDTVKNRDSKSSNNLKNIRTQSFQNGLDSENPESNVNQTVQSTFFCF